MRNHPITDLRHHLRPLGADAADAARLLYDRRRGALRRALDPAGQLRVVASPNGGRDARYRLRFECDAGAVDIAVSACGDPSVALACAEDLSAPLRALATQAVFDGAAQCLRRLGLDGAQAVSVTPLEVVAEPRAGWYALRAGDEDVGRFAVIAVSPGVHDALRASMPPRRAERASDLRGRLALAGSVAFGTRPVAISTLSTLRSGDVLVLPKSVASLEKAPAVLKFGPRGGRVIAAAGCIEDATFTVEGEAKMEDDASLTDDDAGEETDSLGALELPVHFEIETVSVPLAELEAIEPGYVITLATPASEARLRLVSCGRVIGHAEMVAVGDRLGARITRMVARGDE